jgi:tRNA-specific 2-thiouridylase
MDPIMGIAVRLSRHFRTSLAETGSYIMPGMNALGIDKRPEDTRIVVAMSGGVDSSATAALLVEAGFEVIGVTLQLYDHGAARGRAGACCAGEDIHDAKRVADRLGIPHYVLDYESRFRREVIDRFADSYVKGETPVPCVTCNQTVKFRDLVDLARELGAEALATGHYVRREAEADGPALYRAADLARDQSYFLFATTADQLSYLRFPLGGLEKHETRAIALRHGLAVAEKPDSQDICFVPQGRYADVVRKLRPEAAEPGEIVDTAGRVLGRHDGILGFTIGQRRGLGLGASGPASEPLYVVALEPERRRVVVGPHEALARDRVELGWVNWLGRRAELASGAAVEVKLRSAMAPVPASLAVSKDGVIAVRLTQPHHGVAPGQACVFYRGSRVLGGGWIKRTALGSPVEAPAAAEATAAPALP